MTKEQFINLLEAFVKEEEESLKYINLAISDPASVVVSSAFEAIAHHEGVRWAYKNVINLLSNEKVLNEVYKKHITE